MRDDRVARQWRLIRAIVANLGGLTVAEIAGWEGIRIICRDLDPLQAAGFSFFTEKAEKSARRAFIRPFHPGSDTGYFQVTFPGPGENIERLRVPGKQLLVTPAVESKLNERQKEILALARTKKGIPSRRSFVRSATRA